MEAIREVIVSGAVSIVAIIIGMAFSALRNFLREKAEEIRATKTAEEWAVLQSIAGTVVAAVEQIGKDITGRDKLMKALDAMKVELRVRGIHLTDTQMNTLIEGAVHELNLTQGVLYDVVTKPEGAK